MDAIRQRNIFGAKDSPDVMTILSNEELKVVDVNRWNNFINANDRYPECVAIRFAQRFGVLAQFLSKKKGMPIKKVADEAFALADDIDIKNLPLNDSLQGTKNSHGKYFVVAIGLLFDTCACGKEIRAWYNETLREPRKPGVKTALLADKNPSSPKAGPA